MTTNMETKVVEIVKIDTYILEIFWYCKHETLKPMIECIYYFKKLFDALDSTLGGSDE